MRGTEMRQIASEATHKFSTRYRDDRRKPVVKTSHRLTWQEVVTQS